MKRISLIAAVVTVLGAVAWVFLRLYSAPRPYTGYVAPMRTFIAAAVANDSAGLAATGASTEAIGWALRAGQNHPQTLRDLLNGLGASWGGSDADSMIVLFRGSRGGVCYSKPLMVTFVGPPSAARVVAVTTDCLTP